MIRSRLQGRAADLMQTSPGGFIATGVLCVCARAAVRGILRTAAPFSGSAAKRTPCQEAGTCILLFSCQLLLVSFVNSIM